MNIKQPQIQSAEQGIVLRTLAESVAGPGCKFLEIGSWCGDSTIEIGKVAKRHNGHLFCIDWWKGNVGLDLMEIASKEDIFLFFWNRICREGLQDVVIPVRTRSDVASGVLKKDTFDLVFIDADHRYENVVRDIQMYAPLVKRDKGILCGHDCEGRISDYYKGFLRGGKEADYYESVHCGVVLAVGSILKNYSINHSIWSVRATSGSSSWEPTGLVFPEIKDKRQSSPPPIGMTKNYSLFRYSKLVYAAPNSLGNFDITEEGERNRPEVVKANSLQEVEKLIGERISFVDYPVLLDSYRGYNFVQYKNRMFAISQDLGEIDLGSVNEIILKKHIEDRKCIIGDSISEVKHLLDQLLYESLQKKLEEGNRKIKSLDKELTDIKSTRWFRLYCWMKRYLRKAKYIYR